MLFKQIYQRFSIDESSTVAPSSPASGQFEKRVSANKKVKEDKLPGGRADGLSDDNFDPEQLKAGEEEEFEHTKDRTIAREIAKDHLVTDKNYYKKYKKVFGESVSNPVTQRKYDLAKAKNLTHIGWGHWADLKGKTYAWDERSMNFVPTGGDKADDAASHFRGKEGHKVQHHGKNFLVHRDDGKDVDKESVKKELHSKFGDRKYHLSTVKMTDKDGKSHNAVMVRRDD